MSKVIGELFQEIKKVRALNYGMIVSSQWPSDNSNALPLALC